MNSYAIFPEIVSILYLLLFGISYYSTIPTRRRENMGQKAVREIYYFMWDVRYVGINNVRVHITDVPISISIV